MLKILLIFAWTICGVQSNDLKISGLSKTTKDSRLSCNSFLCEAERIQKEVGTSPANLSREVIRQSLTENIHKYLNESADPCGNFHDFACGNWVTYHPVDAKSLQTSAASLVLKEFDAKIFLNLNDTSNDTYYTSSERKVKDFFHSCVNQKSNFEDGLKTLANEFFPMPALAAADEWQEENFDWLKAVAEISYKYGIQLILGYRIAPIDTDHSTNNFWLSHPELVNVSYAAEYFYAVAMEEYLGLERKEAIKVAGEIVDFETKLWKAAQSPPKDASVSTIPEIHEKYAPELDIIRLINISFGYIPADEVYETNPNFVGNLSTLIKATPKRILANYLAYQLIKNFVEDLNTDERQRIEPCLELTKQTFPHILSKLYYRTNNLQEKEEYFAKLWQDIRINLQMMLESSRLSWFDEASREYALEKLHSLKMTVPSFKEADLDAEYQHLNISKTDFLANLKSVKIFNAIRTRESLEKKPWSTYLDLFTPYYLPPTNTIVVPISVLDTDLKSTLHPNSINYAHLGFDLGHEVLHAFSGEGRSYNKLGDYLEWWDDDIEEEYAKRRQCLYNQYGNYTFGGVPLPQEEMQDENAADNGGLLLAYHSYRRWYEDSARTTEEIEMETLPNLNYTNYQLFFIQYSQSWCAYTMESFRAEIAQSDNHSPDEIRAFVPLTNFDEFSAAFKCPKGSAMNPVKKCKFF